MDAAVAAYMREQRVPGMSIAVVSGGRVVYAKGYGVADLEHEVPVTPKTVFPTASALKPLTATAVVQLAERGRLELDAAVQRYCPSYPQKRWPVTALDLLRHQAGVAPTPGSVVFNREHYPSVRDAVTAFSADSLRFEPGTAFLYSNDGYVLLACAVEGASGQRFDAYLREHVLGPARMTSTSADDGYRVILHRARGYVVRTEENTKEWAGLWTAAQLASIRIGEPANADAVDPTREWGAAGFVTSATDLARFAIAFASGALVSDSMRARMTAEQTTRSGEATGFGLGWQVGRLGGERTYSIFGSVWTGSSALLVVPKRRFAVALCSNREFLLPRELANRIAGLWGVAAPATTPD
jgi:serine beta-lactamase-like protein LACTB, mitochondrial